MAFAWHAGSVGHLFEMSQVFLSVATLRRYTRAILSTLCFTFLAIDNLINVWLLASCFFSSTLLICLILFKQFSAFIIYHFCFVPPVAWFIFLVSDFLFATGFSSCLLLFCRSLLYFKCWGQLSLFHKSLLEQVINCRYLIMLVSI